MILVDINGAEVRADAEPDTPLLWVLRDTLGMTGTKFGCGVGLCGACPVQVDSTPARSCQLPVSALAGKAISTIEAIASNRSDPVIAAWIEEQVPQCGCCQAGQIMVVTALLKRNPNPSDAEIDRAMTNICRCGTCTEIRAAIDQASVAMGRG